MPRLPRNCKSVEPQTVRHDDQRVIANGPGRSSQGISSEAPAKTARASKKEIDPAVLRAVEDLDPIYSVEHVRAALGGIDRSSVYRLVQEGKLAPSVRIMGRRVGWRRSDLLKYLRSLQPVGRRNESDSNASAEAKKPT